MVADVLKNGLDFSGSLAVWAWFVSPCCRRLLIVFPAFFVKKVVALDPYYQFPVFKFFSTD